jgi:hypothetical protein
MKRKLIIGAVIFAAAVLLTAGVLALFPPKPLGYELLDSAVDMDKTLELHFEGYNIKLISWDREEIKVDESLNHRNLCEENIEISFEDNVLDMESAGKTIGPALRSKNISLCSSQSWLSLIQFEKYFGYSREVWDLSYVDFYVYVPRGTKVSTYCNGVVNPPKDIDVTNNWSDAE